MSALLELIDNAFEQQDYKREHQNLTDMLRDAFYEGYKAGYEEAANGIIELAKREGMKE